MKVAMNRVGVTLALSVVLAAACSSGITPEAVQSWVGRPAAALESAWGPATREVPDGELRVLIYEEVERRSSRTFESSIPSTRGAYTAATVAAALEAYRIPSVYVRSYLFWVNREGAIVNSMIREP